MIVRLSQISLVLATAFYLLLVVKNNLFDYGSNFAFVENVLNMSTTFEGNRLLWRAIEAAWVHHLFYAAIILWEAAACALCGYGGIALLRRLKDSPAAFQRAKTWAVAGLTLSLLLWYVAFLAVGGEWFLMWQSRTWNGQDAAFRMFAITGLCLLVLLREDHDAPSPEH
ncbi:MAG: DUF2165 domain-containing protein [Puniceicoccaceae bacterium]|nr:MAG: DUF2165 domain-containing protein [Puniceicoccaceae bacterium]